MGLLNNFFAQPGEEDKYASNMGFFQGLISGNIPASLAAAQDSKLKRGLLEAQIAETQAQAAQRKSAAEKQADMMKLAQSILNRGGSYSPGQLGSGSFGAQANADPFAPGAGGGLSRASPEEISMLKIGGVDLTDQWKIAKEGFEQKPGTFRVDARTGRREYVPNVEKGMNFDGTSISGIPGFNQFTSANTMAQEAPKALLGAAGKVNLRKNADGTESPISELTENPTLQGLLKDYFQGGTVGAPTAAPQGMPAPAPMQPRPMAPTQPRPMQPRPAASATEPAPTGNFVGDPAQIMEAITQIRDPQERANAMAAFQEQARRTKGFAQGTGYGKTTAQETAEAADKARAVKQATDDVVPTQQRQSAIDSNKTMLSTLDKALNHPGLATATGLQGTIDPRNYIPGTDAKNFNVVMDQIKGKAFLEAFQSLKGAGQITEVEGTKATNAIARLNQAQSTEEFRAALMDLRDVAIVAGARASGSSAAAAPAPAAPTAPPPKPMKGMVRNGYKFNGGNPADPTNWMKL